MKIVSNEALKNYLCAGYFTRQINAAVEIRKTLLEKSIRPCSRNLSDAAEEFY